MSKIIGNPTTTPMAIPDYNQNNEKKADYIKNRPFYAEDVVVLDQVKIVGNDGLFTANATNPISLVPGAKVTIEINGINTGHERIETVVNEHSEIKAYADKWSVLANTYSQMIDFIDNTGTETEITVNVTLRTVAKKIDNEFLDMDGISKEVLKDVGVKYIKSDYGQNLMVEELVSIEDIPTGSYVLDGEFRTSTNQLVYTFTRGAMFCQVYKTGNKTILHYTDISAGEPLIRTETYVNGQCTSRHEIDFAAYATNLDVHNAIGDVETALDNIIAKYGLGGDA